MKKYLQIGLAILGCSTILSSCSKNSDPTKVTTLNIPTYNLFIDNDGAVKTFTSLANYDFTTTFPAQTLVISSKNMSLPGGGKGDFLTSSLPFDYTGVVVDKIMREVVSFNVQNPGGSGLQLSNLRGIATQAAYPPPADITLPGYSRLIPGNSMHYLVMQYDLGQRKVITFWPDMTFRGTTITNYGAGEPYNSTEMSYRIVMHISADNAIEDKADVIFYNAKFAPSAPELKAIVLKNLDLKFDATGYKISGTSIIPEALMDGNLIENNLFPFENFVFICSGDLTGATASYKVNAKIPNKPEATYSGIFTGSSIMR